MISAGDFRNGITIEYDNNVYQIIEFQHVKPGKGAAFVRTKLKNIKSGGVVAVSYTHLVQRVLTNKYFATVITLFFGYLLTLGGYNNVWPLFGSANQLLAALVLIALSVFLKTTGRTGWTLYFPMGMMLVVTFTALIQKTVALVKNVASGQAAFLVDGLQLIVAILLMVLGVMVAYSCIRKLFGAGKNSEKEAA